MKILIVDNYEELSSAAANILTQVLTEKQNAVLGLATGSTPLGLYEELASRCRAGELDFSGVTTFNLDEYLGLPPDHPQSYNHFMWENLFGKVNVRKENVFLPRGNVEDVVAECQRYESLIAERGPIDLQLLGIGTNGHIGFNEPGVPFGSTTQVIRLTDKTIQANSRFFTTEDEVPRWAISMGIKTIMNARKILLLASGESKASAIAKTVEGPVTEAVPGSVLQLHPDATIILDKAAASKLTGGENPLFTSEVAVDDEGHNVLRQGDRVMAN